MSLNLAVNVPTKDAKNLTLSVITHPQSYLHSFLAYHLKAAITQHFHETLPSSKT